MKYSKIIIIILLIIILLLILNITKYIFDKENFQIEKEKINIVISCDKNQFVGLLATTNSICKHSNNKYNNIHFYFLVDRKY